MTIYIPDHIVSDVMLDFADNVIRITDFDYDEKIGDLIFENMKKTNFKGMTGTVQFDEQGSSSSASKLQLYTGEKGRFIYMPRIERDKHLYLIHLITGIGSQVREFVSVNLEI